MAIDIFPVDKKGKIKNILEKFFGLPEIKGDLAIYLYKDKEGTGEIHLRFKDRKCLIIYVDQKIEEVFRPKINIDLNKTDIKSLLEIFKASGYSKGRIGKAVCYSYYSGNGCFVEFMSQTFIGDFVQIGYEDESELPENLKRVKKFLGQPLSKKEVERKVKKAKIKKEKVINDFGVISEKIFKYAKSSNLNVNSKNFTLKQKLNSFNNNYSYLEKGFKFICNSSLVASSLINNKCRKSIEPVSIIIPSFNSNETISKTLASIESQKINKSVKKNTQVIIIDDCSDSPVNNFINKKYSFDINLVRLEKNLGLANARNVGISLAKRKILIFLDSDIIISKNYLSEHIIRNLLIPNAIFISLKENINKNSRMANLKKIRRGLPAPNGMNDMRIRKIVNKKTEGLYEVSGKTAVEILGGTNYFKDLSYGRTFGIYDLPSMVVGHNMSCRRKNVFNALGFSRRFEGWGLEDSFFGAKMISQGNFIVPVLSCGVYHIDHPVRSGSEEKKQKELKNNLEIYKNLINKIN